MLNDGISKISCYGVVQTKRVHDMILYHDIHLVHSDNNNKQ